MKRASIEVDNLTRASWTAAEGKLSSNALSKAMESGEHSAKIWSSFQNNLSKEEQTALLSKRASRNLQVYSDFLTLLQPPVSAENQRRLASLVERHSSFISSQLQHDSKLRVRFITTLQDCSPIDSTYKTLLKQIAKSPALAKDFETLLSGYMNNSPCSPPLHVPYHDQKLRTYLVNSYKIYATIANTLLKYPENFTPKFIAQTLFSGTTLPPEFVKELETFTWNVKNFLKLLLTYVSTTLVDWVSTVPPLSSEIVAEIKNCSKTKPASMHKKPVNFNEFRRVSACEVKKPESVLTIKTNNPLSNEDELPFMPATPIKRSSDSSFDSLDSPEALPKATCIEEESNVYRPTYFIP